MKFVLNFGAGVNSTALIIEVVRRKMPLDFVIFADTGTEMPETYQHVERMRKWFDEHGITFITVKSKYDKPLYNYYFDKKIIPYRMTRDCTDKFKKQPILRFIKQFKDEGVTQYIGIAYDEFHRMRTSDVKWITFSYPLVDWKTTREQNIETIRKEGMEIPVKSGCFMCPFQSNISWLNLLKTHPELYAEARKIEEQNRQYPRVVLPFKSNLKQIELAVKQQKSLQAFTEQNICGGFCMT